MRNMSGGGKAHSGVRGRRRPSYYRPRAAPPIRPRGQGEQTRPSSRQRGRRSSDAASACTLHSASRVAVRRGRSILDNDLEIVERMSVLPNLSIT